MPPLPKINIRLPDPIEVALEYTARGWPVFPCRHVDEEFFDTNTGAFEVRAKAKSPLTSIGFKAASDTDFTVRDFWRRHPHAMIGVPTGAPIGAFVLDIDVKGEVNGFDWLRQVQSANGRLPDTLTANTASGGQHLYFRHVDGVRNRGALGPGVDVRGDGGYVVAPGSVMADGRRYVWIDPDEEIAEAPQWLIDLLIRREPDLPTTYEHRPLAAQGDFNQHYVDAAIDAELSTLAGTPKGSRNNQLNDSAFALGTFVGAGALSRADAEAGLASVYGQWDGIRLSRSTAKRGLDAGEKHPREVPAAEPEEDLSPWLPTKSLARYRAPAPDIQPDPITPANDNEDEPTPPPMHPDPFTPEAAGGLLGDIAQWVTETAIIPVPELSLSSAIALMAGLFGKKALTPTEAGVNVYITTLMATAGGKGHPPKAIRRLAGTLGAEGQAAVVNGDHTSYAAIERTLRRSPSTAIVMDEFGLTLQDVNAKHQSSVAASIRKFLLAVYDQANSLFDGRIYASAEAKKDAEPIQGPALTVLGMTTAETLYEGLTEASISDGFLNRFLFVTTSGEDREIRPPKLKRESGVPADLVARLKLAVEQFPVPPGGGNIQAARKWIVSMEGEEEGDAYALWSDIFVWQHDPRWRGDARHLVARSAENTIRLATVRAISRRPGSPFVSRDDILWAWGIVYRSIGIIREGVRKHMSGTPAEALRKAIVAAVATSGGGLPYSKLMSKRGVSGANSMQLADAILWLVSSGEIVDINGRVKPGQGSKFALPDLAVAA